MTTKCKKDRLLSEKTRDRLEIYFLVIQIFFDYADSQSIQGLSGIRVCDVAARSPLIYLKSSFSNNETLSL